MDVLAAQIVVTLMLVVFCLICVTALFSNIGSKINKIAVGIILGIGGVFSVIGMISLFIDIWT